MKIYYSQNTETNSGKSVLLCGGLVNWYSLWCGKRVALTGYHPERGETDVKFHLD